MPEHSPPSRSPPARLHATTSSSPALPSSAATNGNARRPPSNQPSNAATADPAATRTTSAPASADGEQQPPQTPPPVKKHTQDLNYMHRPPRIVPNYGKRKQVRALPKTSVSRVLLYDNVTQQQMLDVKVSSIVSECRKTVRLMDMHRNSFIVRKLKKHVRESVLDVDQAMPVHVTPTKVILPPTSNRRHLRSTFVQQPPASPLPLPVPNAEEETTVEAASMEPRGPLGKKDVIMEEDETMPETPNAIAVPTTSADRIDETGTVSASKARVKINAQDSAHEEQGDVETLVLPPPTQPQDRFGASTSFGFSQQEPGLDANANKRFSHTADAGYRGERRRERGGGGHLSSKSSHHHSSPQAHNNGLPDIHASASAGQHPASRMVVHMDNKNGMTRLFHAFQQHLPPELAALGKPTATAAEIALAKDRLVKHAFEERTTEDDRYLGLEKLLVRVEPPNDGYLELSPSFHTPRQNMSLPRPSSLQTPPVFSRRRRRSSASNAGSMPTPAPTTSNSPINGVAVSST